MRDGLLNHRRFLIFGAARSGLAAARLLKSLGRDATIFDEAPSEKLAHAFEIAQEIGVPLVRQVAGLDLSQGYDVLILSPGIPTTHPLVRLAESNGCLIRSEIELGYCASPAPILAITGTNGKTTVTHLTTHLFQQAEWAAQMAGNVGRPLCDAALDPLAKGEHPVIVCEISSYQLETIDQFHPRVACILNVTPDHLDRYKTMENYAAAKFRIAENQNPGDTLVLNAECPYCTALSSSARARVAWFSSKKPVSNGAYLDDRGIYLSSGSNEPRLVMRRDEIPLPGLHNVENVLAALAMGSAMGLDSDGMAGAVRSFKPVPHRIEPVGEIGGVRYYNDSKATNLDSLEKALESFERPVILIAGGRDKGAPWTVLNDLVSKKVKGLVLIGEAAPIGRAAWGSIVPQALDASDMVDAVGMARAMASPGDVVLLSPACASFDMYRNFEERGDHFRRIVEDLAVGRTPQRMNPPESNGMSH